MMSPPPALAMGATVEHMGSRTALEGGALEGGALGAGGLAPSGQPSVQLAIESCTGADCTGSGEGGALSSPADGLCPSSSRGGCSGRERKSPMRRMETRMATRLLKTMGRRIAGSRSDWKTERAGKITSARNGECSE